MGLAVEEMIDDVVENVMELALSRELTADDVVTAYEEFLVDKIFLRLSRRIE